MTYFSDAMPLGDARTQLRGLIEDGWTCPCCTQFAKVYRRKVNSTNARSLITLYRHGGTHFTHAPSLPGDTHEISQMAWWGLVEEEKVMRPDGGRAGWWRITPEGKDWVIGLSTIPKYARVYDHRCLGLTGDPVTIMDALGSKFRLDDLMAGI